MQKGHMILDWDLQNFELNELFLFISQLAQVFGYSKTQKIDIEVVFLEGTGNVERMVWLGRLCFEQAEEWG